MYIFQALVTHFSIRIYEVEGRFILFCPAIPGKGLRLSSVTAAPSPPSCWGPGIDWFCWLPWPYSEKECWIATSQFLTTLGWQERHLPEHHLVLCRACRQRYYEVSCVHSAPLECKVSSSNYPMAACKPNKDFVDSPFLDAPLRKASQVQVNQRAHIKVRGGLANIGLAPQPLLGEAGHQGRSGCLINT